MTPPPAVGRRLGDYHLVRRIAVGGMAEVFEARQGDDPQPLVLKILLPQFRQDPELIKMFEDEARLTRTLNHPNLVRVLEYGEISSERFIVMEHMDGPTLSQLLKHLGRLGRFMPTSLAFYITSSLLHGLDYIHGRSDEAGCSLEIVHRDVTPGNVLISRRGEVKLGDFGIARHTLRSERTRTGVIKGTVQYMSPEQITGMDIDQRTDLYGVGLILFQMLTGQPYIQGEREVELLTLAQAPPWRAPSSVRSELNPEFDRLLAPALARFSEERFPNASSFLSALEKARATVGLSAEDQARKTLQVMVEEIAEANQELTHGATLSTPIKRIASSLETVNRKGSTGNTNRQGGSQRRWFYAIPTALVIVGAWFVMRPNTVAVKEALLDAAIDAPSERSSSRDVRPDRRPEDGVTVDVSPVPQIKTNARPKIRTRMPVIQRTDAAIPRLDAPVVRPAVRPAATLLRKRLDRALVVLAGRGILLDDLSTALREKIALARERGRQGVDSPEILGELQQLELALGAVQVDRQLVERKLKQVDQRLILAKKRGLQVQPLQDRSSVALQAYMDSRYEAANRHLNAIISALNRLIQK